MSCSGITGPLGNPWHYHTMRDREGNLLWEGQYDLYPLWRHFGIRNNLEGQSVIDLGTATGFFAFECERRGASPVVATELFDIRQWDARAGYLYEGVDIPKANQEDFHTLHRLFQSKVQLHFASINEPLHEKLGTFDWVIFGSLMTHLRDPMLALEHVRGLTRGRAVIISSYSPSIATLGLRWIRSERPFDWWVPSKPLLPEMLKAVGFRRIEEVGDYVLTHKNGAAQPQACCHAFP